MDALVETTSIAGAIDVDLHPAVPRRADLLPFWDEVWRETMLARDIDVLELTSYPPNAPFSARPDWRLQASEQRDAARIGRDVLDHFGLRAGILNCLAPGLVVYNEHIGLALCRATNDWIARTYLDADPRLRASIIVPLVNPESAGEEIERLAVDRRFVQVLVLAAGEAPLGRKIHWPIYRAAERHGLPIAIHAGSGYRHAMTQSGYLSSLAEDMAIQPQSFASQIVSLIAEGVFAKFPAIRFVLLESGVTWLPSLMWRMSKDWRGIRTEIPWVKQPPAWLMREHLRLSVQPLDAPVEDVERIVDHLGSDEMLMFATDYPHWQFDGDVALPRGLPARLREKVLFENALATYPRLEATP